MLTKKIDYTVQNAIQFIDENKSLINKQYRNKFHVMPPIGWLNDPNGFIYFKGEYHLFYQFHPYESKWGPMHWGHVKTKDFLNWDELPVALAPDQDYDKYGCFSGSAIEKDGKLYLIYTGVTDGEIENEHLQIQCMAVSEDGIHFEKLKNPIIETDQLPPNAKREDFRDPKVFEKEGTYYMVVASKTKWETGQILLYESKNLFDWTFSSVFLEGTKEQGIMWECPDFFEVDGKDCLIISPMKWPEENNNYQNLNSSILFTGKVNWNNKQFEVGTTQEMDHGLDFYAPQSTADDEGRRICIGWMQTWGRTMPTDTLSHQWAGTMSIPRQLNIRNNKLIQSIPSEIVNGFKQVEIVESKVYKQGEYLLNNDIREGLITLEFSKKKSEKFDLQIKSNESEKTVIYYDSDKNSVGLNRSESGIVIEGEEKHHLSNRYVVLDDENVTLKLQIVLDTSSVEVFVNDGEAVLSSTIFPQEDGGKMTLVTDSGIELLNGNVAKIVKDRKE